MHTFTPKRHDEPDADQAEVVTSLSACFGAALDLLLPVRCAGCHGVDEARQGSRGLCSECTEALRASQPVATQLVLVGAPPLPMFAAASYDGVVRSALLEYKEHARLCLRVELGWCLSASVLAVLTTAIAACATVLVPVPSTRAARRSRGHDPVGALARGAAHQMSAIGVRVEVRRVLRQTRAVADQSGLDSSGRRANLMGALEVRTPGAVGGLGVVIVDDIVTTGATAVEAARALRAAGANVLGVACVAATPRRYPARGVIAAPEAKACNRPGPSRRLHAAAEAG